MARIWSMASQNNSTEEDCALIQNSIIYACAADSVSQPSEHRMTSNLSGSQPLPADNDSGYVASPSSATRLTSFQFGSSVDSSVDSTIEEELLSIDLIFAPLMLLENEVFDENQNVFEDEMDDQCEDRDDRAVRLDSRNSSDSGSSSSNGSESALSTPIAIPSSRTSSPLALSHTSISSNSNRFVANETGFGREMFVRHHRHRYHIGIEAFSPQSPPSSSYWSPYLMGRVGSVGQTSSSRNINYQNLTSVQRPFNCFVDMRQPLAPSPLSSISLNSELNSTSNRNSGWREEQDYQQPLPDVVSVEIRQRSPNGHNQARRAVSVSLPIDAETIRSVGMSLRRLSEEFEISTSRTILSNGGPESDGLFGNMFASISLFRRRSLSTRFGLHRNHRNGRQRSFSTNDATQQ